jgi:hypothetical protein
MILGGVTRGRAAGLRMIRRLASPVFRRYMPRFWACSILLIRLIVAYPVAAQVDSRSPVGTWRIATCRVWMECAVDDTTTRVLERGLLVFNATPFAQSSFADSGWLQLRAEQTPDGRPNPNGCYTLMPRSGPKVPSAGFSRWQLTSRSTLVFNLGEGVDSHVGVVATLAPDGNSFRGVIHYEGRGANPIDNPDNIIVGQRNGLADPTPCVEASRSIWLALRDWEEWGENFRGTRVFPPSIDARAGYILYFWDALADSVPPPTRCIEQFAVQPPGVGLPCIASNRSGYFGPFMTFGRGLAPRETFVIAAAPNAPSIQSQVDSARARVKVLLAAGVRPSRIILFGSGRATGIVLRLAAEMPEAVAVAFVGDCPGQAVDSVRAVRAVFDAHLSRAAPLDRCGSHFAAAPGSAEYQLPPWFDGSFRDGSDDWLEAARIWISAWMARSK